MILWNYYMAFAMNAVYIESSWSSENYFSGSWNSSCLQRCAESSCPHGTGSCVAICFEHEWCIKGPHERILLAWRVQREVQGTNFHLLRFSRPVREFRKALSSKYLWTNCFGVFPLKWQSCLKGCAAIFNFVIIWRVLISFMLVWKSHTWISKVIVTKNVGGQNK